MTCPIVISKCSSIIMASKNTGNPTGNAGDAVPVTSKNSNVLTEGTAKMQFKEGEQVFYNPVQVLNRDVSIQSLTLFSEIVQVNGMILVLVCNDEKEM